MGKIERNERQESEKNSDEISLSKFEVQTSLVYIAKSCEMKRNESKKWTATEIDEEENKKKTRTKQTMRKFEATTKAKLRKHENHKKGVKHLKFL